MNANKKIEDELKKIPIGTERGQRNLEGWFSAILSCNENICLDSEDDRRALSVALAKDVNEYFPNIIKWEGGEGE